MTRMRLLIAFGLLVVTAGCASPGEQSQLTAEVPPPATLEEMLKHQERIAWKNLQKNISPVEPKVPGGPPPAKGVVVAALSKKDPDYYFHWCRDSANVMRTVIEMAQHKRQGFSKAKLDPMMADFVRLSRKLQKLKSPYGLGEPRYTVNGEIDQTAWSRPQFDGPALRAQTILKYLDMTPKTDAATLDVALTDLDFVAQVYKKASFDIWEELKAENYHTRLVQAAALEKGADYLTRHGLYPLKARRYNQMAKTLLQRLNNHWDPKKSYLRSQMLIEGTDGYTAKKTDLDSAVIIAVIESERTAGPHSILDDRVHSTIHVLENLFSKTYPINQDNKYGLGYGRYEGDHYYGGNPWFLVTYYYAQFYYRLAAAIRSGAALPITKRNISFFQKMLPSHKLRSDTVIQRGSPIGESLILALFERADGIVQRLQAHLNFTDGEIYEQFDKSSGMPISSKGIGWGYSTFLGSYLERLNFLAAPRLL